MNRIIIIWALIIVSLPNIQAQKETFEEKVKILSDRIEKITSEERAMLKNEIKEINRQYDLGEITINEAQVLKKKAAKDSAQKIQQQVSVIEAQLRDLIQDKVDNEIFTENNRRRFRIGSFDIDYDRNRDRRWHRKRRNRRTSSNTVLAFGLNNLTTDNSFSSIEDSEFNFWKSHFFEWGVNYKTRVFKNSSLVYIDYGMSVMYNTLKPKSNQFFVSDGNTTTLETSSVDLEKSKFKNVQLVVPVFLELDFSRPKFSESSEKVRYRTNRGVRIGVGGFLGLNIKSKQVLKYKENDIRVKDIQKGDFNVNNFAYGLNAFIGHRDTSFYVKYNLNEVFQNATIEQNNISFGIRFDW